MKKLTDYFRRGFLPLYSFADEGGGDGGGGEPVSVVNADGSFTENWHEKYGEENKAHLSRYKTFDDFANSHIEQRKKFSKDPSTLVEIPTEHSPDEVRAAFKKARGAPDSIDSYEYALSDEMAIKLGPLRDDLMTKVKDLAHKQGWSPQEFKENLDLYHDVMSGDIDAFGEQTTKQMAEAAEKAKAELRKQPGWQSEEEYTAKVQIAQSVAEKYNLIDGIAELNLQNSPNMIAGLNRVADAMSEDTLKGLSTAPAANKANIKARIDENRSKMKEIMAKDPVNYRSNPNFRDLDKSNTELYKQFPAK